MRLYKRNQSGQIVRRNGGQIVVEYVLLLTVAVTIAMIIISQLVKRDSGNDKDSSGALIHKWRDIQDGIGKDVQN